MASGLFIFYEPRRKRRKGSANGFDLELSKRSEEVKRLKKQNKAIGIKQDEPTISANGAIKLQTVTCTADSREKKTE